jgi:RNase adapter protein RapZ
MRFVIITGISGAGKSQVSKCLEDMGFFCVDNLPPLLIPKFAEICCQNRDRMEKIALIIDIRGGELLKDFFPGLAALVEFGLSYEILFLEASDEILIKRYKESRRSHPLAKGGRLSRGIKEERAVLRHIKMKADHVIDTSNLTTRQLRQELVNIFIDGNDFAGLIIHVVSFGFKYGVPTDCDLVFDVRFLPNPYYEEGLRILTGKSERVGNYVLKYAEATVFLDKLKDMVEFLVPHYIREGKSQLVICIGCTGGKHRSVAIADVLYGYLLKKHHRVVIDHRDMEMDNRKLL